MKKTWNLISTILVWGLIVFAIGFSVFTIISLRTVDANNRSVFGYKAYIVRSDSMSATDFSAGDLIFVKEVDVDTLEIGDIISFRSQNSHNYGQTVTHKIRAIDYHQNGSPFFITYGTTTGSTDESPVFPKYIYGKYVGKVPGLGRFFNFLKSKAGYVTLILIPLLVILALALVNVYKTVKGYTLQENGVKIAVAEEEKNAYLAAIEEERKENEQMRQEIEALKATVAKLSGQETVDLLVQAEEKNEPEPARESSAAPVPAPASKPLQKVEPESAPRQAKPVSKPAQKSAPAGYDELDLESIIAEFTPKK